MILSECESEGEVERLERGMNVEVVDVPSQSCSSILKGEKVEFADVEHFIDRYHNVHSSNDADMDKIFEYQLLE